MNKSLVSIKRLLTNSLVVTLTPYLHSSLQFLQPLPHILTWFLLNLIAALVAGCDTLSLYSSSILVTALIYRVPAECHCALTFGAFIHSTVLFEPLLCARHSPECWG